MNKYITLFMVILVLLCSGTSLEALTSPWSIPEYERVVVEENFTYQPMAGTYPNLLSYYKDPITKHAVHASPPFHDGQRWDAIFYADGIPIFKRNCVYIQYRQQGYNGMPTFYFYSCGYTEIHYDSMGFPYGMDMWIKTTATECKPDANITVRWFEDGVPVRDRSFYQLGNLDLQYIPEGPQYDQDTYTHVTAPWAIPYAGQCRLRKDSNWMNDEIIDCADCERLMKPGYLGCDFLSIEDGACQLLAFYNHVAKALTIKGQPVPSLQELYSYLFPHDWTDPSWRDSGYMGLSIDPPAAARIVRQAYGINFTAKEAFQFDTEGLCDETCDYGFVTFGTQENPETGEASHAVNRLGEHGEIFDPGTGLVGNIDSYCNFVSGPISAYALTESVPFYGNHISINVHSPVQVRVWNSLGVELEVHNNKWSPYLRSVGGYYNKVLYTATIYDVLNDDTTIGFEGTTEAVAPNSMYGFDVKILTSDGETAPIFTAREIPIAPNELQKIVVSIDGTANGTEARPFFTGKEQGAWDGTLVGYLWPLQKTTTLPTGNRGIFLIISYSNRYTDTFKAELNGVDVTSFFHPVAGKTENVHLTAPFGTNITSALVITANGKSQDGKNAKYKGSLSFISTCASDNDNDGVCVEVDNCPNNCNINQLDADGDGIGDVCDSTPGCGGCGQPQCEQGC